MEFSTSSVESEVMNPKTRIILDIHKLLNENNCELKKRIAPMSRSQAKRVLARIQVFKTVLFDFAEVASIGQAFADEIFRVFALSHPDMELSYTHANPAVTQVIRRAQAELINN